VKEKICVQCGFIMTYRKKWAKNWDSVKYCSDRCRGESKKTSPWEEKILSLLKERQGKTICPSEVLPLEQRSDKSLMEEVRMAARRMTHAGLITIEQNGKAIDPTNFKGPIRLREKS